MNLEGWSTFTEDVAAQSVCFKFKTGKLATVYSPNGVEYDHLTPVTPECTNNFTLITEAYNVGTPEDIDLRTIEHPIVGWRHTSTTSYPVALGVAGNILTRDLAKMAILDKSTKKLWRVDGEKRFESMSHYIDHYYELELKAA